MGIVAGRRGEQTGTGRRWGLSLADRVLLVAVYYRTNLTLRQVAPLFGISKSAAGRCSANLQVVIDTDTPLTVAIGKPLPGNAGDCRAYRESGVDRQCAGAAVMADGGYQGTGVIMPYRKPADGTALPEWKADLNAVHKRVRARVEHTLAHLKTWNILRNCRRKKLGVCHAALGVAQMRNLTMTC